jgi:hypothetical protein
MPHKAPAYTKHGVSNSPVSAATESLSVAELTRQGEDWLLECRTNGHLPRALEFRRHVSDKLIWLLHAEGCQEWGLSELRRFLAYVAMGHEELGGR